VQVARAVIPWGWALGVARDGQGDQWS